MSKVIRNLWLLIGNSTRILSSFWGFQRCNFACKYKIILSRVTFIKKCYHYFFFDFSFRLYLTLPFVLKVIYPLELSIAAAVPMIKTERVGEKMNVGLIKLDRPKALNALCNQLMQEVSSRMN